MCLDIAFYSALQLIDDYFPGLAHDGEIDFVADNPGDSLFHCHMQDHQDFGFMSLLRYA